VVAAGAALLDGVDGEAGVGVDVGVTLEGAEGSDALRGLGVKLAPDFDERPEKRLKYILADFLEAQFVCMHGNSLRRAPCMQGSIGLWLPFFRRRSLCT
jgi:hypothetical protein